VLGVHLDACAQLCLAETSFPCASFDYVYDEQSCQLSQYIAANVHGIRTEYDSKYQVMHYELIGKYMGIHKVHTSKLPDFKHAEMFFFQTVGQCIINIIMYALNQRIIIKVI
jgi:hypothetical protein